jgi:hypothetical protein
MIITFCIYIWFFQWYIYNGELYILFFKSKTNILQNNMNIIVKDKAHSFNEYYFFHFRLNWFLWSRVFEY